MAQRDKSQRPTVKIALPARPSFRVEEEIVSQARIR